MTNKWSGITGLKDYISRLKSALIALGLKCGGTLQERAERLFMTKGKKLTDLSPALFAKTKPGSKDGKRAPEKMKEVAKIEANIYRFAELLAEVRNATVENVERKQVGDEAEILEEVAQCSILE